MRFKNFDAAEEDGRLEKALEHNIVYIDNDSTSLKNIKIGYNTFECEVGIENEGNKIVLNQNYHHLWQASIDGKSLEVIPHNNLTMAVKIPKNISGTLKFEYKSPRTKYTFIISLLAYVFVIGFLIKNNRKVIS